MSEREPIKIPEKKPRQFNRMAAATALGVLIGIIVSYTSGQKDYAVIGGTLIGALVGFVWDWLATRSRR